MMKKSIIIITAVLFIFCACKKDAATVSNNFSFQLANTTYTFDSLNAIISLPLIFLNAVNTKTHSSTQITLQTNSADTLTGIYSSLTPYPENKNVAGGGETVFLIISGSGNSQTATNYNVYAQPFTLTISQITSSYAEGTFSGNVIQNSPSQVVSITNGQFKIPIH